MGDRALIVFHAKDRGHSPVLYQHWGGHGIAGLLQEACSFMADRPGDLDYIAARTVGIAHSHSPRSTGIGIFNSPEKLEDCTVKDFSHGDAGVFLVDVSKAEWVAECFNGYGFVTDEDGDCDGKPMKMEFKPAVVMQPS